MQYGRVAGLIVVAMCTACAGSAAGSGGDGGSSDGGSSDGGSDGGTATGDLAQVSPDAAMAPPTLDGNRDRLLATYLVHLQAHPGAQSNGLDGAALASVCDLWNRLAPSDRAVYLTLTARMQGSRLGSDGSAMLSHVVRVYRLVGGQSAGVSAAGSCGGAEYNRMIMSMDGALHSALVAAHDHNGAAGAGGAFDLADVAADNTRFWRDSHDVGGPHPPFDLSDETQDGAPRGQVQCFRDPSSSAANAPLGRMDLTTLVDPFALEMDQDYDCVHNSNPACSYITYGPLCVPQPSQLGIDLFESHYGTVEPTWHPSGC